MDDSGFDALARRFAATRSRRAVVRALAGTAGGGLLALAGLGGADAASCKTPKTACGKGKSATCTNLGADPKNCGACGTVCTTGVAGATATCQNGVCATACPAGQFVCAGRCVDHAECCEEADCPHLQRCGYWGGEMICYCQISCVFDTPSGGCADGTTCIPFGENSSEGFCSTTLNVTGFISDGSLNCPEGYEFGMLHFGSYGCIEVTSCPPGVPQA